MNDWLWDKVYMKIPPPYYKCLYNIYINSPVNRDSYIELCTPICISYDILKIQETDEIIDSIDVKPDFIYGHYNVLRKITIIEDVEK